MNREDKSLYWPEAPPEPELVLTQEPGSVYFGNLTGPIHQVEHLPALEHDASLLEDGSSSWAVSTMLRSEYFPHGRFNRLRSRIGSPTALWETLAEVHARWVREEVA